MSWLDARMAAYDIETTGVDVEEARIVTAAVAFVGGGEPTEAVAFLADPGIPIPDEAAAVHGVSTERACAEGLPAATAIESILNVLSRREPDWPVVAFNARFDLTILDREARRHGLEPLAERGPLYVIDPYVIDKHLDRYRRGSRKLDAICAHYGAVLDEAHEAGSDAIAAARCAWVLGTRGHVTRRARDVHEVRELHALRAEWERVRLDLPALHEAQIRWAGEQARSLAEYFALKGEPQHVEPEWPLIRMAA